MKSPIFLSIFCFLIGTGPARSTFAEPLPEGTSGIASRYPGDVGIASDPQVIFADDFESSNGLLGIYGQVWGLASGWNEAHHIGNIRIAKAMGNVFGGSNALEFVVPKRSAELTNSLVKYVYPPQNVLFLRYYAKFDAEFNVLGSSHNGGTISARYCCPGVPANGFNKFFVSYEAWRDELATANPGKLNIYVYYPDQRDKWGDHIFPTGLVLPYDRTPGEFGPDFVARPNIVPQLGRWYCYELMVRVNTPGKRDGRIGLWLDGILIADFPNLRLRDTEALQIDRFSIDLHVRANVLGVAKKWYDNVVAATSYIGPVASMTK